MKGILKPQKEFKPLAVRAIIMGSHGKGIKRNTFLVSTTLKVLRRAKKPVFIIPLPEGELDITLHDN